MNGGGALGGAGRPLGDGATVGQPGPFRPIGVLTLEPEAASTPLPGPRPDDAPVPAALPRTRCAHEPAEGCPLARSAPDAVSGLLRLAGRFARAADDRAAHDLFAAAFGLYSARHFGLAPDQDAADLAEVSWWHGPTVGQPLAPAPAPVSAQPSGPGGSPTRRRPRRGCGAGSGSPAAVPEGGTDGAGRRTAGRHRKPELPATGDRPDAALGVERRTAARMLLAHPLVTAAGPHAEALPLIRRHADWLAERFDALLGYRLVVTDGFARLVKAHPGADALRGLEIDGRPCPPEVYAALALALAELLAGPPRRPLPQLTARLLELADTEGLTVPGLPAPSGPAVPAPAVPAPALTAAIAPGAVAAALDVLATWQVLSTPATPDGAPEPWLAVDQQLACALSVGCADFPSAEPAERSERHAGIPVAVRRRLAETPVVLLHDLTALEREWLWESRRQEAETFADFLGLTAEIRKEGVALLDPAGELTDLRLPGADAPAHAALLLVERLAELLRPLPEDGDAAVGVPIPEALIDGILGDIADEYGAGVGWRPALAHRSAFRREVLGLLHRMSLITPAPAATLPPARPVRGWLLLAPAARYAAPAVLRPTPGNGRHSRRAAHP
ncbi:DUF2398 family protein [Kitasatospora sp. NPDC052896]|uniref:DUF2398 family protein n=1 Tax=Kitasatospora sp. NPDC052896 TaxID=3364061 RepID=UPI0037C9BCA9